MECSTTGTSIPICTGRLPSSGIGCETGLKGVRHIKKGTAQSRGLCLPKSQSHPQSNVRAPETMSPLWVNSVLD